MAENAKWCFLCDRYVVPTKSFNAIGWVGFAATLSLLVASVSNETLSRYVQTTAIAASVQTGVGNIMLNVLLLLVAPFLLISIVYCLYWAVKKPRCPICNSKILRVETSPEPTVVRAEPEFSDTAQIE
ncbi:MAG: hypothetical protein ACXV3D_05575 [Halobacteriota archaeon]